MYDLKLRLLNPQQAQQVRQFLQQHPNYGHFEVQAGTNDALGGDMVADQNLHIRTTNMQMLEHALDEHFNPQGHNWRTYVQQ